VAHAIAAEAELVREVAARVGGGGGAGATWRPGREAAVWKKPNGNVGGRGARRGWERGCGAGGGRGI